MNRNSRFPFFPFVATALAVLVLFTSACSLHLGTFTQVIELTLNDELLTQGQPTFTVNDRHSPFDCVHVNGLLGWNIQDCLDELKHRDSHNFWEEFEGVDIQRMELHDGFVRLLGTCAAREAALQECSFDVALYAQDGMLVSEIIAVDVPGLSLDDERILSINQDMQVQLYMDGLDAGAKVYFQEVSVTEEGIHLLIEVTITI